MEYTISIVKVQHNFTVCLRFYPSRNYVTQTKDGENVNSPLVNGRSNLLRCDDFFQLVFGSKPTGFSENIRYLISAVKHERVYD